MELLKRDIELRLDITDRCNLKCVMCWHGYDTTTERQEKKYITTDYFKNVIGEILPRVNIINLSVGNEPLLNKDLREILLVCCRNNIPQVVLTTNLISLTDTIAETLTDGYVHQLHISMDAGNKHMYEMIRQNSDFEKIVSNINKINNLKKVKNSLLPNIVFNYVLMKINFGHLKKFIDFSNSFGIKEINCAELRIPANYRKDLIPLGTRSLPQDFDLENQNIDYSLPEVKKTLIELVRYAGSKNILLNVPYKFELKVFGMLNKKTQQIIHFWRKSKHLTFRAKIAFSISYLKNFLTIKNVFCSFPWRWIVITTSGDVIPCCTWSGSPVMGNINNEPISKIWGNENYLRVRKGLLNNELPVACKNCIVSMKKRHGI